MQFNRCTFFLFFFVDPFRTSLSIPSALKNQLAPASWFASSAYIPVAFQVFDLYSVFPARPQDPV